MKKEVKIILIIAVIAFLFWYYNKNKKVTPKKIVENLTETANADIEEIIQNQDTNIETPITVVKASDKKIIVPNTSDESLKLFINSINSIRGKQILPETDFYNIEIINLISKVLAGTTVYDIQSQTIDKTFIDSFNSAAQQLYNKKIIIVPVQDFNGTIKKGDKGVLINQLQKSINLLMKSNQIKEYGCFDKETAYLTGNIFKTSGILLNERTGEISSDFVHNFYITLKNIVNL